MHGAILWQNKSTSLGDSTGDSTYKESSTPNCQIPQNNPKPKRSALMGCSLPSSSSNKSKYTMQQIEFIDLSCIYIKNTLHFKNPTFSVSKLTLYWVEEVKKRIVRYLFSNRPNCASTLVFLFFLDCFNCNIFSFLPINSTPKDNMWETEF